MSNISWVKKNIIKNLLAALVIVGLLVNMEGVQGIGTLRARAGVSFPDEVRANGEIDTSLTFPEDSYCDGVYIIFCSTEEKAQAAVSYIEARRTDQLPRATEMSAYASYGVVEESDLSSEASVSAPSRDADYYGIASWKKKGDGVVTPSDVDYYHFVAVYVAAYDITIQYDTDDGTPLSNDSYTPVFENTSSTVSITLPDENSTTRDGYRLVGWHGTSPDGDYRPGDALGLTYHFTWLYELKAVWEEIHTVTITYRPNGGTGSAVNKTIEFETDASGDGTIELLSSANFTREGYTLAGWKVTEPGKTNGTSEYALGAECTFSADAETLVFDAIWERTSVDVSVQYKPNGGTGDAVTLNKTVSISASNNSAQISLLDKADFKKSGYTLTGWSDGNKTYSLGANYSFSLADDETSKAISFDAVWTEKKKGTVDISIKKPAYVGAELKYDIEKNSGGDVKVEYKKKDAKDSDYTKNKPTDPGKYTVRATLEETDEYTSAEDTSDFEIVYLDTPATPYSYQEVKNSAGTVTDLKIFPAEGYSIGVSATGSFGTSVLYSAAKTAGGVYLKDDKSKGITAQVKLTEYSVKDTPKITVPKEVLYGTEYAVTATSLSPADKTVTYKKAGSASYSATVPTEPGSYTVRLSAPASGFYAAVDVTADFSIVYLDAPADKAYLDGKKGNGDWFKSDVKIKAPKGYLISSSPAKDSFSDSIDWNKNISKLYYKRVSDGAITDGVVFDLEAKIDNDAPEVEFDNDLGIKNPAAGVSVCLDELSFTLKDDNLDTVTVNGVKQTVTNGKCVIKLDAGSDTEKLTVVATDKAGNSYTFTIELSPQWMSDNTMPAGRKVKLKSSIAYYFGGGSSWMVETADTKDNTVYTGGNKFYVKADKEYTFSKQ